MLNPRFIEVVGRLVEQEDIRLLNERVGKQESCLLASGKLADLLFKRSNEVHGFKNV